MLNNSISFWLNWKSSTIIKKNLKNNKRPLTKNATENDLKKLINERLKIYSEANFKINCENLKKYDS